MVEKPAWGKNFYKPVFYPLFHQEFVLLDVRSLKCLTWYETRAGNLPVKRTGLRDVAYQPSERCNSTEMTDLYLLSNSGENPFREAILLRCWKTIISVSRLSECVSFYSANCFKNSGYHLSIFSFGYSERIFKSFCANISIFGKPLSVIRAITSLVTFSKADWS